MRDVFPEYFINQNLIDFENLDNSVLIVLDTNILLDLYRFSPELQKKFMKSIKKVERNLWMPYQVGFEFNRNRKNIIYDIAEEKKKFIPDLSKKIIELIEESNIVFKKKYKMFEDIIDNTEKDLEKVIASLDDYFKKIDQKINKDQLDDILFFVEEVYTGKVASNISYNYSEWEKEAATRFEQKRPPGYKDYSKKKDQYYFINDQRVCSAYGDFFMWKEILEKAKDDHVKEVILVTRDVKEDWFYETKGKKIGARVELVEELLRVSNTNFRIFTNETFLSNTTSVDEFKSVEQEVRDTTRRTYLMDSLEYDNIDLKFDYSSDEQLLLNLDEKKEFKKEKFIYSKWDVVAKIDEIEGINKGINNTIDYLENWETSKLSNKFVRRLISEYYVSKEEFDNLKVQIFNDYGEASLYFYYHELTNINKKFTILHKELETMIN